MADIRLGAGETALWHEAGTRGDAFREATRDRVFEQVRLTGKMTEIIDDGGKMLDSVERHEPVLEAAADHFVEPGRALRKKWAAWRRG